MRASGITLESLTPLPIRPVVRRWWRRLIGRPLDGWDLTGGVVASGPFHGMRYATFGVGSVICAKMLGTYECELHPWVGEIIATPYRRIHVVGCAEGYYAIGLARSIPAAIVLAYDLDPRVPSVLADIAARNGVVSRVRFSGEFSAASLDGPAGAAELIVCDVEGAELSLLDPSANPRLLECDLLVEVHDGKADSIERVIASRFATTHSIRRVIAKRRTSDDLPPRLRGRLPNDVAEQMMNECRSKGLTWLFMQRHEPVRD
jgi:hypothetical protein